MMNTVNRAIHHLLIRAASLSQALGFAFDLIAGPKPSRRIRNCKPSFAAGKSPSRHKQR
jgi:hypothetical protein